MGSTFGIALFAALPANSCHLLPPAGRFAIRWEGTFNMQ